MKIKLTETQIQALYKFTRQHYVYHYDVQSQLVDHLANDIEQICVTQPHLSFIEAREKSFKKFGVFGFMDVVEARQKAMTKKYWKILFRFVKEWFQLPKIVITSGIFLVFYFVMSSTFSKEILMSTLLVLACYEIYISFKLRKQRRKKRKEEKLFLLEEMIGQTKSSFTLLTLINLFNFVNLTSIKFNQLSEFWVLFIALFATLFTITSYITSNVIPKKAQELLEETYPEYKMVKSL